MKKIRRRLFRLSLKARQQGAALLEFALLVPLILSEALPDGISVADDGSTIVDLRVV